MGTSPPPKPTTANRSINSIDAKYPSNRPIPPPVPALTQQEIRPVRAEDIYKFQPSDKPDDDEQGSAATYQTCYSPSTRSSYSPFTCFPSIPQRSTPTTSRHKLVPTNAEVTKVNAVRHVFLNAHYTSHSCDTCQAAFTSRNLLFAHLNEMNHFSSKDTKAPVDVTIIQSKANPASVGSGYAFRDFNYCEIRYLFNLKERPYWGCLDTGGGMSLIGGPQVNKLPWTKRVCLKEPIKVKGYDGLPHESWEVVVLEMYFPDTTGKKFVKFKREFQ